MSARGSAPLDESETKRIEEPAPRGVGSPPEDLSLCIVGENSLATYLLPAGRTVVLGRSVDADVRIDDASMSRRHARIRNDAVASLEDLGSANGTRIGDRRLAPGETAALAPGDRLTLGAVILLVTRAREPADAGAPRVEAPAGTTAMERLHALVERIARSPISVLVFGETGVGKEVMAEAIHRQSSRADGPFLRLNCGAFSDTLLDSELFGHERGAFTGATATKLGRLESAGGGTVFLDEIGEMPPWLQVKLLRVIEDRQVIRVGGLEPRSIDVRFVAATHRDLEAEVERGAFRQDLFFRLNGISLTIPPLRERVGEIEGLARLFLAQAATLAGRRPPRLSAEARGALAAHAWPGNIRELKNVMERALVLCTDDLITRAHLPVEKIGPRAPSTSIAPPPPTLRAPPAELAPPSRDAGSDEERRRILSALEQCAGNQTHAARLLGISRGTLLARLDLHGLPRPRRGRGEPA